MAQRSESFEVAKVPSCIRTDFLGWLDLQPYAPSAKTYVACLDQISEYLIRNEILSRNLWQYADYQQFKLVFDQLLRNPQFLEINQKTYDYFKRVGRIYLEFLEDRATLEISAQGFKIEHNEFSQNPQAKKRPFSSQGTRTFVNAFVCVLEESKKQSGLTVEGIFAQLGTESRFSFLSSLSLEDVKMKIEAIEDDPKRLKDYTDAKLRVITYADGRKTYSLIHHGTSVGDRSKTTIRAAAIKVLKEANTGLTAQQIYKKIIEKNLYSFGAKNPVHVLKRQIERACVGSKYAKKSAMLQFRSETNNRGEKIYFLLTKPFTKKVAVKKKDDSPRQEVSATPRIWDPAIGKEFEAWLKSEGYKTTTAGVYSNIIERVVQKFQTLAVLAIQRSSDSSQAIRKFTNYVHKEVIKGRGGKERINQTIAILGSFRRFALSGINIDELEEIGKREHAALDRYTDFEIGKKGVSDLINSHFATLYGYSNCTLVWHGAQNEIPMFLNDNAINSERDLWAFLTVALEGECFLHYPHIWEAFPDHPLNAQGLVVNLARHNGGIVTREKTNAFFEKVKLSGLTNSQILENDLFFLYKKSQFILAEIVQLTSDGRNAIGAALKKLFHEEKRSYIILRDIDRMWFSQLPELPDPIVWTPLLLQEVLVKNPTIGYKVVFSGLKGQALDTLGAAITPAKGGVEAFSDVVYLFIKNKFDLPKKLSAESLRSTLRKAGMLKGNELIYNMHKVLNDPRFAFSSDKNSVTILER